MANVYANAANDENLNETLERIFKNIENSAKGSASEDDFIGLFDDIDVNSNKLGASVAKRNERLEESNINAILDCYGKRTNIDHISALVHHDGIKAQDYNLSVSSYVAQKDSRELVDIKELNAELARIVAR